jgi:hypothetical protein
MYKWDGSHNGVYHFYGHAHSKSEYVLDQMMPDRRSLDIGVDNAYQLMGEFRPFREGEIMSYLAKRMGHDRVQPEDKWNRRDYEGQ